MGKQYKVNHKMPDVDDRKEQNGSVDDGNMDSEYRRILDILDEPAECDYDAGFALGINRMWEIVRTILNIYTETDLSDMFGGYSDIRDIAEYYTAYDVIQTLSRGLVEVGDVIGINDDDTPDAYKSCLWVVTNIDILSDGTEVLSLINAKGDTMKYSGDGYSRTGDRNEALIKALESIKPTI